MNFFKIEVFSVRIFNKNQISFDISWFKLILLICYSCKLILKWVSRNKTQMARKHLLMVIKHLTLKQSKKETQNNFPTATTTSLSPRICRAGRAWSWLVLISKENLIFLLCCECFSIFRQHSFLGLCLQNNLQCIKIECER